MDRNPTPHQALRLFLLTMGLVGWLAMGPILLLFLGR